VSSRNMQFAIFVRQGLSGGHQDADYPRRARPSIWLAGSHFACSSSPRPSMVSCLVGLAWAFDLLYP
jgi:hypothetical protein